MAEYIPKRTPLSTTTEGDRDPGHRHQTVLTVTAGQFPPSPNGCFVAGHRHQTVITVINCQSPNLSKW
jgi:hypothetical protein